jgi:hypothetical protein
MGVASLLELHSELLWPQQGVDEIDEERRSHDAAEDVFDKHGDTPSETIAGVGVGDGQGEEADASGQQDCVHVGNSSDEKNAENLALWRAHGIDARHRARPARCTPRILAYGRIKIRAGDGECCIGIL